MQSLACVEDTLRVFRHPQGLPAPPIGITSGFPRSRRAHHCPRWLLAGRLLVRILLRESSSAPNGNWNLRNMSYREPTPPDWWRAGAYILAAITTITGSAVILSPIAWPLGFLLWLVAVPVATLFTLVRWHARSTAYRCPVCGNEFEISTLTDFVSPHSFGKQYLKCPRCGNRSWMQVLIKEER
jgi:DNA-directed RNA polymerase subunit RPC12/RpoP